MSDFRYTPEMTPEERKVLRGTVTREVPPGLLAEQMLYWRERAELTEVALTDMTDKVEAANDTLARIFAGD